MSHFLAHPSAGLNLICRRAQRKFIHLQRCIRSHQSYLTHSYFVSSGCPVSQSPAVDYGRSEISGFWSNRSTLTELAPDSSPAISLNFHLLVMILHSVLFFPAALTAADKSLDTYISSSESTDSFHTKARQFHYPNSKITRFPVPEEKVPWEVFHILCQHRAASGWSSDHQYIKRNALLFSCSLFSGQLQIIYAELLHL